MNTQQFSIMASGITLATVALLVFYKKNSAEPRAVTSAYPQINSLYAEESSVDSPRRIEQRFKAELAEASAAGSKELSYCVKRLLTENEKASIAFFAKLDPARVNIEVIGKSIYHYYAKERRYLEGLESLFILDENPELSGPLLPLFITRYYKREPQKAITWIGEHSYMNGVEDASQALGRHATRSKSISDEIQRMLDSYATPEMKALDLKRVFEIWSDRNLKQAIDYIKTTDEKRGAHFDQAMYTMAGKVIWSDPEMAVDWAFAIHNKDLKRSALAEVSRSWHETDRDAIESWIYKQDEEIRLNILDDIIDYITK